MNHKARTWIVAAVVAILGADAGRATNFVFTGSPDNLWTNKASWTPNTGYPGIGGANNTNDDVTFDNTSPDNVLTNGGTSGNGTWVLARNLLFDRTSNFSIPTSTTWVIWVYGTNVTARGGATNSINTWAANVGSLTGVGLRMMCDQTWNIDANTVLSVINLSPYSGYRVQLTKTGGGDLILNGLAGTGVNGLSVNIQTGRVIHVDGSGAKAIGWGVTIADSATFEERRTASDGYSGLAWNLYSNAVNYGTLLLNSTVNGNCYWVMTGTTNTWTLRGNSYIARTLGTGDSWLKCISGTIELDYSQPGEYGKDRVATNVDSAFVSGTLRLTGSTEGNVDEIAGPLSGSSFDQSSATPMGGIANLIVNHGDGKTARLTFTNTAAFAIDNPSSSFSVGPLHLRFAGSNLTTGANDLGSSSKIMLGNAALTSSTYNILSGYAYAGADFATHDWSSGSGQGVIALSASGRPGNLNTVLGNVLTTGDVPLPAVAVTNNSLKFGGAHALNLNGQTLTLRSGGIIQAGANNTAGISNGTLRCANGNTTGTLYLATFTDLTIASNVTLAARCLSKVGEGKLTLWAAPPGGRLYWQEGSLDYRNDLDASLMAYNYYGPGALYKAGTGTVTLASRAVLTHTGGTVIANGALKLSASGSGDLGDNGPVTVNSPGVLWCPFAKTFAGITLGGSGTLMGNAAVDGSSGTTNAFTLAGCTVRPGGSSAAGILTVNASTLGFSKNGSTYNALAIDVLGGGGVAGTDYDQLYVTGPSSACGKVGGVSTINLQVSMKPGFTSAGPLTIVNAANTNFTGAAFNSVTWLPAGATGTVNYVNGSITLTALKSPGRGTVATIQ